MARDDQGQTIQWANAGKRPTIFVIFHVSILIPVILLPFVPGKPMLFVIGLWMLADILLQRYDLSLLAAISRVRLWGRAGLRTNRNRRTYQKLKKGSIQ